MPVLEGAPSKGRGGRGGRGGGPSAVARKAKSGYPTLGDLVEAGVVVPGKSNISVVYKGVTYVASLNKDGMILYQGGLRWLQSCWLPTYALCCVHGPLDGLLFKSHESTRWMVRLHALYRHGAWVFFNSWGVCVGKAYPHAPSHRQTWHAGKRFQSATSFSIHCKRQQTPNKQGDDGWKVLSLSCVAWTPGTY